MTRVSGKNRRSMAPGRAALIVRSMVLSAQSAGQQRLLLLQRAVAAGEEAGELARLRDENGRLKSELRMLKDRFGEACPPEKRCPSFLRVSFRLGALVSWWA